MSTLTNPRRIVISSDEIIDAVRNMVIKKEPNLEEEEFEISLVHDSYNNNNYAIIEVID